MSETGVNRDILAAALSAAAQITDNPKEKVPLQARAKQIAHLAVLIARETERELSGKPAEVVARGAK